MSKSHLSQYVNGKSSPDQHKLYLLGKTLNVNEAWLMGYDVPKNREDELDIVKIYNNLEISYQKKVYSFAEQQLKEQTEEKNKVIHLPNTDKKSIVSGRCTAAGNAINGEIQDSDASIMIVDKIEVPREADELVTIAGDSMEPLYKKGTQVFIHYQPEVEQGEIAVVAIDGEGVTCKQIYYDIKNKQIVLRSINEKYDDMIYNAEDIRIIGKVL